MLPLWQSGHPQVPEGHNQNFSQAFGVSREYIFQHNDPLIRESSDSRSLPMGKKKLCEAKSIKLLSRPLESCLKHEALQGEINKKHNWTSYHEQRTKAAFKKIKKGFKRKSLNHTRFHLGSWYLSSNTDRSKSKILKLSWKINSGKTTCYAEVPFKACFAFNLLSHTVKPPEVSIEHIFRWGFSPNFRVYVSIFCV